MRRFLFVVAALTVFLLGVRLLSLQGYLRPVRVASGSMAPALLGPRYQVACGDCGSLVQVDARQAQEDESVVCSNCGFAGNDLRRGSWVRGERVLIDRGAFWLRRPRRFEVVALSDPSNPERFSVKRVIGLPGESLEIRGGELYANGRLVRKSLPQLREMAVPVYDDRFRPQDESLPRRWADANDGWASTAAGYAYPGDFQPFQRLRTRPRFAWLRYHHWRCSPLPGLRTRESPVLDDYGYNLGPPRTLNPVTDLMIACRVRTIGEGCLAIALDDGRETWEIRLWPSRGEASLGRAGREAATATFPRWRDETPFLLEAAICDSQILAAVEGKPLFVHAYEPASTPRRSPLRPLALGAAGLAVDVTDLLVTRDVFYLPRPGRGAWSTAGRLGDNEHLLFGDNAPISQDSRVWDRPAVASRELLGPVLSWFDK